VDTLSWYLIPLLEVLTTSLLAVQPRHYAGSAATQFLQTCAAHTSLLVSFTELVQEFAEQVKIPVLAATLRWGRLVLEYATKHKEAIDTRMQHTRKIPFLADCQKIRQYLAVSGMHSVFLLLGSCRGFQIGSCLCFIFFARCCFSRTAARTANITTKAR